MAYTIVELPLYPDDVFTYKLNIEGRSRKFVFSLNKRTNIYHLSIYTESDEPIVLGIPLLPRNTLLNNYSLEQYEMTGYLYLMPRNFSTDFSSVQPGRLSEFYGLAYIYESA